MQIQALFCLILLKKRRAEDIISKKTAQMREKIAIWMSKQLSKKECNG